MPGCSWYIMSSSFYSFFFSYGCCNYWDTLNIIYLLGSCSSLPPVEVLKPQQHSKASFFMNITCFPEINHRDDWQVNCFMIFFRCKIFSDAIKTKHNRVSVKRRIIGWNRLLKIPVSCCDHPKRVSHHWCSAGIAAPFFLLSDFPTWVLRQSGSAHPPECKIKHLLNPKGSKNYLSMIICFIAPKFCTSLYCWERFICWCLIHWPSPSSIQDVILRFLWALVHY